MQGQFPYTLPVNISFGRIVPSAEQIIKNDQDSGNQWEENRNHCHDEKVDASFGEKRIGCETVGDEVDAGHQDVEEEELQEYEAVA